MDKRLETSTNKGKRQRLIFLGSLGIVVLAAIAGAMVVFNKPQIRRPQEPSKPYPYYTEDITFNNKGANVTLAGTLTLPSKDGNHPAVILISGSGPQTRDYEFAAHKSFLVLADHLTRRGIAVLRYDDRGFGKSTGDFFKGSSLDFSFDAESALEYLMTRKEIRKDKIGLIGHSDGAMIAPMIAARSSQVSFIVLLAAPGIEGPTLLLNRQELIERKLGRSETEIKKSRAHSEQIMQIIMSSKDSETAKTALTAFSKERYNDIPSYAIPPGISKDDFISRQIDMFSSPWFRYFLTYEPEPTLRQVKCPVLALSGDKDVQAPSKENLEGIRNALNAGENQNATIVEIPGVNHALQECNTGMPDEYGKIEQTISPVVLNEISRWIAQQVSLIQEN